MVRTTTDYGDCELPSGPPRIRSVKPAYVCGVAPPAISCPAPSGQRYEKPPNQRCWMGGQLRLYKPECFLWD